MTSLLSFSYKLLAYLTIVLPVLSSTHGAPSSTASGQGEGTGGKRFLLGLGTADITGPVVETNMMGYASMAQTDTGLHMRQRARAFIIADASNPSDRVVFVNADICMGDSGVLRTIVSELETQYPGLYHQSNVALVGTHAHSGVGGYLENLLPQLTALGYVFLTASAISQGTLLAIQRAHESLALGDLSIGNATINGANVNRSPYAYLANPASERAQYNADVDKEMSLLRFDADDSDARGFLSWFAVHGTSLYENNTLVSGDNKGMAAYLYEAFAEPGAMPGNASFVAGFVQANVGDTSPNTLGAFCETPGKPYDGQPCSFDHSTCGNRTEECHGRGPGFQESDFASNAIIGSKQFEAAKGLMTSPLTPLSSSGVKAVQVWLDMSNHSFTLPNGTAVRTCPAALGYSFAGGTTDGPGAFDFIQGDNSSQPQNPFWEIVKEGITPKPSDEQVACQSPKPILLNSGEASSPYQWSPNTVALQMFRIGNLIIAIIPGELTTMSGRRLRNAIRAQAIKEGVVGEDAYVVVAGPANVYGHYIATREEYSVQRYEGASTLYGPFTLEAYINKFTSLVKYLGTHSTGIPIGDAAPENLTSKAISLQTAVVFDSPGIGRSFGDVLSDVSSPSYKSGDAVKATFVGADPRNDLRLEGTFLSVEQQQGNAWVQIRSDSHPSTTFEWERTSTILGTSSVTISWTIEEGTPAGSYRLVYHGDSKAFLTGAVSAFQGVSKVFNLES